MKLKNESKCCFCDDSAAITFAHTIIFVLIELITYHNSGARFAITRVESHDDSTNICRRHPACGSTWVPTDLRHNKTRLKARKPVLPFYGYFIITPCLSEVHNWHFDLSRYPFLAGMPHQDHSVWIGNTTPSVWSIFFFPNNHGYRSLTAPFYVISCPPAGMFRLLMYIQISSVSISTGWETQPNQC